MHRLPRTLAALESGALQVGQLWPLLEKVAPIADPKVRGEVEADLLAWAAGRVTTPAQLGAKARRMVLARDARGAAQRLTAALRRRGAVWIRPDETDGMAVLSVLLTVPEAAALLDALGRYADALEDDVAVNGPDGAADGPGASAAGPDGTDNAGAADAAAVVPRTRAQKMADVLLDLVLRANESELPPVRGSCTLVAPVATMVGGDRPGEVDGQPVPAEMVRSLARAFGLMPAGDRAERPAGTEPAVALPGRGHLEPGLPEPGRPEPRPPRTRAPSRAFSTLRQRGEQPATSRRWWAEVEDRVLTQEWGGGEAPPPEELERYWRQQLAWETVEALEGSPSHPPDPEGADPEGPDPEAADRGPDLDVGPDPGLPGWWGAADRAVDAVGEALLTVDRGLSRARGAVRRAEVAAASDEAAWQQSGEGRLTAAEDAISALAQLSAERRAALAELLDATGGGGLVDRPRIAVTDALSGALLALTDARGLRAAAAAGRGLGPPGPSGTYRPAAALDRFVRARDRRCRFPGCRRRVPLGGQLDHNIPWPDGATSAGNLEGFCTSHHRGKHQAPGWQYDLAADGTLTVTTPTGLVVTTTPPPY